MLKLFYNDIKGDLYFFVHTDFMDSYSKIWDIINKALRETYTKELMDLWLNKLELVYLDETEAIFTLLEDDYFLNLVNKKYSGKIEEIFKESLNMDVKVKIFSKSTFNLDEYKASGFQKDEPVVYEEKKVVSSEPISNLNTTKSELTFENFVVGSTNKFAYSACISIANEPASNYNPLLIYGNSGIGKTHLITALAIRLMHERPELKVLLVTGEAFTSEFVECIRNHQREKFQEKYRNMDVLLIDDIQFISGKAETQEEFFHTFNILYENHKQIVLTSDRPPKDIKNLTERIKTRFEGGLIVDIQPPDTELKIAILQNKAKSENIPISNEYITYLVENINGNVRTLLGALKGVSAASFLSSGPVTLSTIKKVISPYVKQTEKPEDIANRIINNVSIIYDVSVDELKDKSRKQNIAHARNMAIYAIREKTSLSLESIGKIFSRDHTTILNSIERIKYEIEQDTVVAHEINEIYKDLY